MDEKTKHFKFDGWAVGMKPAWDPMIQALGFMFLWEKKEFEKDTCKHFRSIRNNYFGSYHLSGIVIDSFVYAAIQGWRWIVDSQTSSAAEGDYERALRAYLEKTSPCYHSESPGSGQTLNTSKSIDCLIKVVDLIAGQK